MHGSEGNAPLIDFVTVVTGLEAALGAAFGDDLDASSETDAPAHWRQVDPAADDPAAPRRHRAAGGACPGADLCSPAASGRSASSRARMASACSSF